MLIRQDLNAEGWQEALEFVVDRTRQEAYRKLCDESNPLHVHWRHRMLGKRDELINMVPQVPVVRMGNQPPSGGGCGTCDNPAPPSPPNQVKLTRQMKTAATAAIRWVANGFAFSRPETQANRLAICNECDRYDKNTGRCKECTCFMMIKVRAPKEECPLGKWKAESPEPTANRDNTT